MEIGNRYLINIVGHLKNTKSCFIIVEQFNKDATTYFLKYYKHLLSFENEKCDDWFKSLDCPRIDVGRAVITKINNKKWFRGIISKSSLKGYSPELYLIDSQRFTEQSDKLELRICPLKFLQLSLPTFYVDLNLCFDDENVKNALEMLITQNQRGKISFCFTPRNIEGNVYHGEFEIYEETNNSYRPLKKLIKHFDSKIHNNDINEIKTYTSKKTYNPLKFKHLKSIFLPKDPYLTDIFEKNLVLSLMDLQSLDSYENTSQSSLLSESSSKESIYSNHGTNVTIANNKTCDVIPIYNQNDYLPFLSKKKTFNNLSSSSGSDYSRCSLHSLLQKKSKSHHGNVNNCDLFKFQNVSLEKSQFEVEWSDSSESIHDLQSTIEPINISQNTSSNDTEIWWSDSSE